MLPTNKERQYFRTSYCTMSIVITHFNKKYIPSQLPKIYNRSPIQDIKASSDNVRISHTSTQH